MRRRSNPAASPVHVATSAEIGRRVARVLRHPVHFVSDNLLVGPCTAEPDAHLEARCDFWDNESRARARFRRAFRESMEAIQGRSRMVVWSSPLWSDRVAEWALCAFRLARWPARPNVDRVQLGLASNTATGFGHGSIRLTPADIRRDMGDVRPLSLSRVRDSARLWKALTRSTPVLAQRGRHASGREDLREMGTYQAGFFPRVLGSTVVLSRFDALLFSCLGSQWSTPAEVFVSRGAAGEDLRRWLAHAGDIFMAMRLRHWAEHNGSDAALESEPYRPERVLSAARYRLSAVGAAIKQGGLHEIASGAPLPMWGAVAYDPLAPWVVVDDDAGRQHIQQLGER